MAYKCPRCSGPVQRSYSSNASMTAGLVGALFYSAFGAFGCSQCGKILRSEFPREDRAKMALGSVVMVVSAILIVIVCIAITQSR